MTISQVRSETSRASTFTESPLTVALARLEAAHAEVTNAVHARDVNSPAAEPATIVYVLCLSIWIG